MRDTRNILPIVIAAVIALGVTVAARWLIPSGQVSGKAPKSANNIPMPDIPLMMKDENKIVEVNVLVVGKKIPRGTKISPDFLTWKKWPKNLLQTLFIAKDLKGNPLNNGGDYRLALTMWAGSDLVEGEPVMISKLLSYDPVKKENEEKAKKEAEVKKKEEERKKVNERQKKDIINKGMRAITFPIDQRSATSLSMLSAGDYVDVLIPEQKDNKVKIHKYKAIKVLAIDGSTKPKTEQNSSGFIIGAVASTFTTPKNVTLEIKESLVETMLKQVGNGGVILSLRNQGGIDEGDRQSVDNKSEEAQKEGELSLQKFLLLNQVDTARSLQEAQEHKKMEKENKDRQTNFMIMASNNRYNLVDEEKILKKRSQEKDTSGKYEIVSGKIVGSDSEENSVARSEKKEEKPLESVTIYRQLTPSNVQLDENGKRSKVSSSSMSGIGNR